MSRLIYAEDVKALINGLDSLPFEEEVDDLVDRIPTAYDVNKVVEQLEVLREKAQKRREELIGINSYHNVILRDNEYERGRVYAFDDAIEVVKEGGIDGNSKDNSSS